MQGTKILALLTLVFWGSRIIAAPPPARIDLATTEPAPPSGPQSPPMQEFLVYPEAPMTAVYPLMEEEPVYRPRWKLLAGGGFYLAAPFVDNNRAFTVVMPSPGGGKLSQSTDFGNSFSVAPRFWLGVAGGNGWGFRTSFWHFNQTNNLTASLDGSSPADSAIFSASPLGPGISTGTALLAPGNADVLSATSRLNLTVLDFELTREIELGPLFMVLSGGGRYARLTQNYNVNVINTANNFFNNAELDQLRSSQRFNGGGPTLALQGWYPLGQSRFSIYGLARGTVLFGETRLAADTSQLLATAGTLTASSFSNFSGSRAAAIPVGELELGLQWTGNWPRFRPFIRTGVMAQTWFNALTTGSAPAFGGDTTSINSNLSFLGVVFQAGLNY